MKSVLGSIWFWLAMLLVFLAIILYDSDLEKEAISKYVKGKMKLTDVHFSEMDKSFEQARIFADEVEMDDSQTNMIASRVRALFFDKQVATRTANVVASMAYKNPYEIKFVGDVRMHSSDNERLRSDEMRYFVSRKEIYTSCPVTIWKDDLVLTGREMQFNTETKTGVIKRDILIRIWRPASGTAKAERPAASGSRTVIPVAPPPAQTAGADSKARQIRALAPVVQMMLRSMGLPGIMAGRSESIRMLLVMADRFSAAPGGVSLPGLPGLSVLGKGPGGFPTLDSAGKMLQGFGILPGAGASEPHPMPAMASPAATGMASGSASATEKKPGEEFPPRVPVEWLMQKNGAAIASPGGNK